MWEVEIMIHHDFKEFIKKRRQSNKETKNDHIRAGGTYMYMFRIKACALQHGLLRKEEKDLSFLRERLSTMKPWLVF